MASLANKDSYLQRLAKKICAQEVHEPRKRKFASPGAGLGEDGTQPKKKKKKKKAKKPAQAGSVPPAKPGVVKATKPPASKPQKSGPGVQLAAAAGESATALRGKESGGQNGVPGSKKEAPTSLPAMNFLRQRLHEKMEKVSGQASSKELSPAVLEKRQRRKYERERKKRRRKELRLKEKMEKEEAEKASTAAVLEPQDQKADEKVEMVFNTVKVPEEELSKAQKRKEKMKRLKGNITPLTGKNYKQLLSRLEMRKNQLEELKEKDEKKAQELETKMKWTNVLYKAEGVKIRDDEDRLKAALKRKEKQKAQRQKQWEKRTEQVVDKMQQRQDKRRRNLQKKKLAKVERKKAKARKKGRILPEDLEKAGLK
ncbi:surfeit locus protein 6 [Hemicordylus capensis]|uniref:surfeit locus protein 6 n=1 Tax=Hemicordylus capensis TaxID=884348 RepID=UPI0023031803|nr:surfeit locus protein 6 [Hemicordylus capensis]XP_053137758.1 surfeit locus protein 6 [Hemicordylus capensis]